MDAPGPWGTGPFTLSSGYSSIQNRLAIIKKKPFAATWLTIKEERTPLVVLEANPNYWAKNHAPKLKRVVFRNDLSPQEALHVCITTEGQVDIVTQLQPSDAKKVIGSPFAKIVAEKGNQVLAGAFNRFQHDVNFNDPKLRLACNLAVDRDELIKLGFHGFADHVPAMTPTWATDYPENIKVRPYNPTRARQLLKNAGWEKGRSLRLATTEKYQTVTHLIAKQMKKALQIKVDVFVIPTEQEVKWQRVIAEKKLIPNWDILMTDATALFYEDTPAFFHREFFGFNGALRTGPELPQFDQMFKRMAAQTDKKNRLKWAKEIDRLVYKQALALFLCIPQSLYAVNKQVDFQPYRTTLEFADTAVTRNHWSKR